MCVRMQTAQVRTGIPIMGFWQAASVLLPGGVGAHRTWSAAPNAGVYSRDQCPDCIQIVIGLVVARSGLQLGYDVFHGNQAESPTLGQMMAKMEALYPKLSAKTAAAIWSAPHARC